MSYCIRVLAEQEAPVAASAIKTHLDGKAVVDLKLDVAPESDVGWGDILFKTKRGRRLFVLHRNAVSSEAGGKELKKLTAEIEKAQPQSGADWLKSYLPNVRAIYALELILHNTRDDREWAILHSVHSLIWSNRGGIIQSDGEGISNKSGQYIVWQFADNVTGEWGAAVRNGTDWTPFMMNLGDQEQRKAFFEGKVPAGPKLLQPKR